MRGLVLVLFVLTTLPMAFAEPFIGFLLWALFSYMNPYREVYGFAAHLHWVQIISIVTLLSMLLNSNRLQRIRWDATSILLVLFLLWTAFTTLFAVMHTLAVAAWIQFFKIQVLVFATLMLVTDKRRMHWLIWVIVLSFGFWAAKGGVFTLLKGGQYHVVGPRDSFYGDNNQFALVMCMTLPLMRYLQLQLKSKWVSLGMWGLMALTGLSILGSYSRGGLIALGAVLLMLIMKGRYRFRILLIIAVSVPLAFNFLPPKWKDRMDTLQHAGQTQSLQERLQSWEFATNVAIARPYTSGGFSSWASANLWQQYGPPGAMQRAIHSIFFQVLGEQGFVGLGLFLALLFAGWRNLAIARRAARGDPSLRWLGDLAGFLQVSFVGYVVAGAALPQAYFNFTYELFALSILVKDWALRGSHDGEPMKGAARSAKFSVT